MARVSWPVWLIKYQNGEIVTQTRERSPIPILTSLIFPLTFVFADLFMDFRSLLRTHFYKLAFNNNLGRVSVPRAHDSSYYIDTLAR